GAAVLPLLHAARDECGIAASGSDRCRLLVGLRRAAGHSLHKHRSRRWTFTGADADDTDHLSTLAAPPGDFFMAGRRQVAVRPYWRGKHAESSHPRFFSPPRPSTPFPSRPG